MKDAPKPSSLEGNIESLLTSRFHLTSLYPFQQLVIQRIVEDDRQENDHRGTLVVLPTGGGKSLCFMLPSILVEGITILVYPLLSLMHDQTRRLDEVGIPYICIHGGQSQEERSSLLGLLNHGQVKVLVTNAECLILPQVFSALANQTISLLVLDEAHTIVSWGEGFRPALAQVGTIVYHLPVRQVLCFTATADAKVLSGLDRLIFQGKAFHIIHASSNRTNITYHVMRTISKRQSIASLLKPGVLLPTLIFCATRVLTEVSAKRLTFLCPHLSVRYYHAGLTKEERQHLEHWFSESPKGVLFATKAFGMGVDVKGVRCVIHHDLSEDVLSFLQESGRAGRDGKPALSITLLDGTEKQSLLLSILRSRDTCFRNGLMQAMNEDLDYCGGCDICNGTLHTKRQGAKAIITSVLLHPLRFTPVSLASMLQDPLGWELYAGTLLDWGMLELQEAIQLLIKEGKLCMHTPDKRRLYVPLKRVVELLTTHLS
ncbi:MAG: RecQ family ATP-dependent DNA helicase [Sphaerochaeta sp.]